MQISLTDEQYTQLDEVNFIKMAAEAKLKSLVV